MQCGPVHVCMGTLTAVTPPSSPVPVPNGITGIRSALQSLQVQIKLASVTHMHVYVHVLYYVRTML